MIKPNNKDSLTSTLDFVHVYPCNDSLQTSCSRASFTDLTFSFCHSHKTTNDSIHNNAQDSQRSATKQQYGIVGFNVPLDTL